MTIRSDTPRCGRKTRNPIGDGRCRQAVEREGEACRFHGGASPQAKAKREQRRQMEQATQAVRTYGLPVEVDPADALLEEVHRTAGHVAYLHNVVGEGRQSDLMQEATGPGNASFERASVWVELYQAERAHLINVCKAAIAAGIEERRVKLAEKQGEMVGELLRVAIEAMGASDDQRQRAYGAIRGHLSRAA